MKVLFAAAEAAPFIKTGGLGEVVGSLPKELKKQGVDVRVILPLYGDIPDFFRGQMEQFLPEFPVSLGWRQQPCEVKKLEYQGVIFYFIDNEYYYKNRPGVYGFGDEGERYAYFCSAVLALLPSLGFQPDIIHCHDWHTGMIGVLLKARYVDNSFYQRIKTVFTIHNLQYQGVFPLDMIADWLGLEGKYFSLEGIEYYGQGSFMKGGIAFAQQIITVSETYAQEIQTAEGGEGLDGLLRWRSHVLKGIINGIDTDEYNPQIDEELPISYGAAEASLKAKNKVKLQEKLRLEVNEDIPLVAVVSRLAFQKGIDLIIERLQELMSCQLQLVILGTGEEYYQERLMEGASRYPRKMATVIGFEKALAKEIYAASDFLLMPSLFEPCGLAQLVALRYGTIPIVRATGGLKDTIEPYDQDRETGYGITFKGYSSAEMLEAVQRGLAIYWDKYKWEPLRVRAMELDFSWSQSAGQYQQLYQELVNS
ncbi:MAG: glycogen synthase GlgA [Bacillota bacterium]|nr:glycogen synthase GlgA [Bacillota bacterium]